MNEEHRKRKKENCFVFWKHHVFFKLCFRSVTTNSFLYKFHSAGAFATQVTVICYFQTGQSLMIIMSVSWVYATFFLGLFSVLGPENNSGQVRVFKVKEGYRRIKACLYCRVSKLKEGYRKAQNLLAAEVNKPVRA